MLGAPFKPASGLSGRNKFHYLRFAKLTYVLSRELQAPPNPKSQHPEHASEIQCTRFIPSVHHFLDSTPIHPLTGWISRILPLLSGVYPLTASQ